MPRNRFVSWRCRAFVVASVAGAVVCPPAASAAETTPPANETVVVAAPVVEAIAERRVDAETIATSPRSSTDDLLRLVPGLLITRHGAEGKGRQMFLRGFDAVHGADLEITVDDVPWNEASNVHGQGYLDLQTLIPEAIQSIDAEKGGFRLDQGPFATAGSVRFSLGIAPGARGTRIGYELGSTNRHRAVVTSAPATGGSFVAVEVLRDGGYGENRETRRAAINGKLVLAEGVELLGGAHVSRFGEPGTVPTVFAQQGRVGFYDSLSPDTGARSDRAFGALRWRRAGEHHRTAITAFVNARWLTLQENFTGFLIERERGDRLQQTHRAFGGGLRLRDEVSLGERVVLLVGASVGVERIDQHEDRIDAAHVPFARTRALDGLQANAGARAGLRWLPVDFAKFDAGLRAESFWFDVGTPGERDAQSVHAVLLPRVAATLYGGDRVTAVIAYGRGVRPPEARAVLRPTASTADVDVAPFAGGPARPTVSDGIEAGVRWRPVTWIDAGAGTFATFISREQIFDHVSGVNLELNATRRVGVEADASLRPRDWLLVRVDATTVDARFVDSGRPVPGAPTLFATAEAHVVHPSGWMGGARVLALGPRPLAHGARAGSAGIADLLLGYRRASWDASLTVENVLGTQWREGEFNYASWFDRAEPRSAIPRLHYAAGPPRVVRVGLAVRF